MAPRECTCPNARRITNTNEFSVTNQPVRFLVFIPCLKTRIFQPAYNLITLFFIDQIVFYSYFLGVLNVNLLYLHTLYLRYLYVYMGLYCICIWVTSRRSDWWSTWIIRVVVGICYELCKAINQLWMKTNNKWTNTHKI